jgi:hypothetical protein
MYKLYFSYMNINIKLIRGIKLSSVKLIFAQINFAYIVSI